jgi:RNA binding exosome subunit
VKRDDLRPYLQRELDKWSAKSYDTLRQELKDGNYTKADKDDAYHLEVDLLENCDDYVHVSVAVCSERVRWSCIHPLSASFLVYRDGRVKK